MKNEINKSTNNPIFPSIILMDINKCIIKNILSPARIAANNDFKTPCQGNSVLMILSVIETITNVPTKYEVVVATAAPTMLKAVPNIMPNNGINVIFNPRFDAAVKTATFAFTFGLPTPIGTAPENVLYGLIKPQRPSIKNGNRAGIYSGPYSNNII